MSDDGSKVAHRGINLGWLRRMVPIGLVLMPVAAFADVGTPLVWANAFHLLIGNAILGIAEGWFLARVFKIPLRRCVGFLISANYVSAWVGMSELSYCFDRFATDISVGLRVIWLLIGAAYLLTLLIEWPFVVLAFPKGAGRFAKSLRGNLIIQTASYVVLFGGYWLLSGKSLYTEFRVVPANQIAVPDRITMFYMLRSDGDVYKCELGDAQDEKVFDLNSTNQWDHLVLRASESESNTWDLLVYDNRGRREDATVVLPSLTTLERVPEMQGWRTDQYFGWSGSVFQVGAATNSAWKFAWAHWPDIGMWGRKGTEEKVRVALGTPLGGWSPYRAVHLPGDQVLLQLDARQICLVDVPNRKIALIRRGYGFLALLTEDLASQSAAEDLLRCGNLMVSICTAARMWAADHDGSLPTDLASMMAEFATPQFLICPADRVRVADSSWDSFTDAKSSYEIVAPDITESDTNTVFLRCRIHGTTGFADGAVSDGQRRRGKVP